MAKAAIGLAFFKKTKHFALFYSFKMQFPQKRNGVDEISMQERQFGLRTDLVSCKTDDSRIG